MERTKNECKYFFLKFPSKTANWRVNRTVSESELFPWFVEEIWTGFPPGFFFGVKNMSRCVKGGPEPLEKESHEFLGSKRLRNVMIDFPTLFLKWYQKHVKVRYSCSQRFGLGAVLNSTNYFLSTWRAYGALLWRSIPSNVYIYIISKLYIYNIQKVFLFVLFFVCMLCRSKFLINPNSQGPEALN